MRELAAENESQGLFLADIPAKFVGGLYEEFAKSLENKDILIGVLENTGNFYNRRQEALAEAQKNPNMEKIVANLKKAKTLKSNIPVFNPPYRISRKIAGAPRRSNKDLTLLYEALIDEVHGS